MKSERLLQKMIHLSMMLVLSVMILGTAAHAQDNTRQDNSDVKANANEPGKDDPMYFIGKLYKQYPNDEMVKRAWKLNQSLSGSEVANMPDEEILKIDNELKLLQAYFREVQYLMEMQGADFEKARQTALPNHKKRSVNAADSAGQ